MHHLALRIPSSRYITYRYVPHSLSTKFAKLAHTYYPLLTDKLFSSTIAPPYTVCRVAYSNNLTLKKPVLTNLATQIITSKTIACISLLCLIQPVPISTFPMSFIYKIQLNTSASVEGASILNIFAALEFMCATSFKQETSLINEISHFNFEKNDSLNGKNEYNNSSNDHRIEGRINRKTSSTRNLKSLLTSRSAFHSIHLRERITTLKENHIETVLTPLISIR